MLDRVRSGEGCGEINVALEAGDRDVVLFGSSRCKQHFDPVVIEAEAGLRAYNAGANGQGAFYALLLAELMLQRGGNPRYLVLHVDEDDVFSPVPQRASVLLPWASESPSVVDRLAEIDPWLKLKLTSELYPYNSMTLSIVRNLLFPRPESPTGFAPLSHARQGVRQPAVVISSAGEVDAARRAPWSPLGRDTLRDFARLGRRAGLQVIFVMAPLSVGVVGEELAGRRDARRVRAAELVADLARVEGARFVSFDERRVPEFQEAALFNDPGHLSPRGARLLSSLLARELAR